MRICTYHYVGGLFTKLTSYAAQVVVSAFVLLSSQSTALADPKGGKITGGEGEIVKEALETIIKQETDLLTLEWDSFN